MHRLFVALRPPRATREQLLDAMGGVPGARWQSDDQLHLTLRFIGESTGLWPTISPPAWAGSIIPAR